MADSLLLYIKTLVRPQDQETTDRQISYVEVLGISWALHFIYTFYSIFALYIGVRSYEYFSESKDFTHLILNSFNFSLQKISMFIQISVTILYPLTFYFSYKFWVYLLKFYSQIFNLEPTDEEVPNEIIKRMYTSNAFLILPIFGAFLSFFSQVFLIYQGVVKKLNFSKTQAFLVLLTPFFIFFILAILIVSYLVFLFSLL